MTTNLSVGFASNVKLPKEVAAVLKASPKVHMPHSRAELFELAMGGPDATTFEVAYDVPGKGRVVEAEVVKCRNGLAVNYPDKYMRRRDPDCMLIADDSPSDKERFHDRFKTEFDPLREEILAWLSKQELIVLAFCAGNMDPGYDALLIAPANAGFFAGALADLQGMVPGDEIPDGFSPRAIIFVAPPFRHTHAEGRQIVVHNRREEMHELFSLNLYPGPSAKKGVYGVLLAIGESEGWLTAHGSTVQVVTPYDNILTIMHEGASGSGKSEMLEYPHRERDGRLLIGENVISREKRLLTLNQGCELRPVTDDMALCLPHDQGNNGKLVVTDAEQAWFLRVNHIDHYGVDPNYEALCVHPPEPILFLNIEGVPNATCLMWEHVQDAPGKSCPNPRVVLPRGHVPNVVDGPVEVDVRSFGVRTPVCTRDNPSYGIVGMMHYLPRSLGWLWRLVSPRGDSNPSITESKGLSSEGVGSYWPFSTGRKVDQANLLLRQIVDNPRTRFTLSPNQHIGAWKVGFMPQWIAREYLARRGGARFRPDQITPSRCPLLGFAMASMLIEGSQIAQWLLEVEKQREVGTDGYDAGAALLTAFFKEELSPYLQEPDLDPLGRRIIEMCLNGASVEEYADILPSE
ncbi:DUF4914 domain-containing protein [candidate division BRC1 bacterium HGW-BRC1-1]|jgi:hypothetical protein|nr:MAG: DUF4914 domain-containing protein [candidate division BRC1 bacterium HGW-BRC1-1]